MLTDQEKEVLSKKLLSIDEFSRSVGEEFIKYMDSINLSFKTIEIYTNYLMQLDILTFLTGNTQECITNFINERTKRSNKRISNHHHPVIRFFLKRFITFAITNYEILGIEQTQLDILKTIVVPKSTGRKRKDDKQVLNYEDINKIINIAEKPGHKLMIKLSFFCGLRMKELLSLLFDDIDLTNKIIKIRPEISKGNKGRIVPIIDILPITDTNHTYNQLKLFIIKKKKRNLDNNIKSKKLFSAKRWQWQYLLEKYSSKALGFKIQPHALRHACGTFLSRNGADIQEIQKYLGHSNMQTTMLYLHKNTQEINDKITTIFTNYNEK